MKDFSKNIVFQDACIVEAMKKIGEVPTSLTLFAVDEQFRLVGTLTDGDIRRGFILGLKLNDPVERFMLKSFHHVNNGFTVHDFKEARAKGIRLLPVLDKNGRIEKVYDLRRRKSILPLECVIMAGGRGERLRPLTDKIPKPMLPLGDRPILEYNIDRVVSFGIEKIYIAVKYLGQQIMDYFGDGSGKGISIEYIWEDQPLGTAGALSLIDKFNTKHIILMNSDIFTDADLEDLYLHTIFHKASVGVATVPYSTKIPYGIFTTNDSRVTGIKEKPIYTNYANAGIYVLDTEILNEIPENSFYNITDLMERLIDEGKRVVHNPIIGYWIDIGQHQDYINAQEIIKHLKNGN